MEWTEEHLSALNAAIILGVKRVEYHDKIVEYRSLDDMMKIRRLIMLSLGLLGGKTGRVYASVSKGVSK